MSGIIIADFLAAEIKRHITNLPPGIEKTVAYQFFEVMRKPFPQLNERTPVTDIRQGRGRNFNAYSIPTQVAPPVWYAQASAADFGQPGFTSVETPEPYTARVPDSDHKVYSVHNKAGWRARLWRAAGNLFNKPKWIAKGLEHRAGWRPTHTGRTYRIHVFVFYLFSLQLKVWGFYEPLTDTFYFKELSVTDDPFRGG